MDYIRGKGDFHKEIYIVERTNKAEIRPEDKSEETESSGEFVEQNTVERAIKTKMKVNPRGHAIRHTQYTLNTLSVH